MYFRHLISFMIFSVVLLGCKSSVQITADVPPDDYIWLEEVQAEKSLNWVKQQNSKTQEQIESLPAFKRNEKEIRKIILAKDRVPSVRLGGSLLYNFWQDEKHVRGIWRRSTLAQYKSKNPKWETVLDIDQLAKAENENWIYKGNACLEPEYEICMVKLSRGGKDASVFREFNIKQKKFVTNGFYLPEAKSQVDWVDKDTLLVATDFGSGSLTSSGYARIVKLWKRNQPLEQARTLFEGQKSDVSVSGITLFTAEGRKSIIQRDVTFYETVAYELLNSGEIREIPAPHDAQISGWLKARYILTLRKDWKTKDQIFKAGSVVALPENGAPAELIFQPNERQSISSIHQVQDALLINYLDTVQSRMARARFEQGQWKLDALPFPEKGELSVNSADAFGGRVIVTFESFLTPSSVMMVEAHAARPTEELKPEILKQAPARFDSSRFQVDQIWATSRDGTKVPYFLLRKKNLVRDGNTPVLIYGYGGFEISETPFYPAVVGKAWLEKGGAYALANIRGGGEFGPTWHQAALKENRQRAYDDFIAVAESLVAEKISSPKKMAISGGSNGGLLVGATFVQRPDLYAAVICKVPLLDMIRYDQLLAGASWTGEYGVPSDPKVRPAIMKYSPYQNVKPGVSYPEVFFITSTADDRVHPGHARKMVAKMKAQGHPVLYFENMEGGHSAAANLEQRVKFAALEYTFLQNRLLKK